MQDERSRRALFSMECDRPIRQLSQGTKERDKLVQSKTQKAKPIDGAPRTHRLACILSAVLLALLLGIAPLFDVYPFALRLIQGGIVLFLFEALLRSLTVEKGSRWVILGSFFVYAYNLSNTKIHERALDVGPQLEYLNYLAEHHRFPPGDLCFVCHHPPLYHVLAHCFGGSLERLGVSGLETGYQLFALPCMIAFAVACALILKLVLRERRLVTLGCAMASLWPYSIILSARLHNDVLVIALMAWTIYACLRFYQRPSANRLSWALALSLAATFTKMNGVLSFAFVFVTLLAHWHFGRQRHGGATVPSMPRKAVAFRCALALLIVGVFLGLRDPRVYREVDPGSGEARRVRESAASRFLGSASSVAPSLLRENRPYNYLYVDLPDLVRQPYALAWADDPSRELFWNQWLKSCLFSTSNYRPDGETSYPLNRKLAAGMMLGLLGIMFAAAWQFFRHPWSKGTPLALLGAMGMLLMFAGLGFRIMEPTSHHSDFRHIYPLLICLTAFFLDALQGERAKTRRIKEIAFVVAWAYVAVSALYFYPKHDWIDEQVEIKQLRKSFAELACTGNEDPSEAIFELGWDEQLSIRLGDPPGSQRFELFLGVGKSYEVRERSSGGLSSREHTVNEGGAKRLASLKIGAGVSELHVLPAGGAFRYEVGCIRVLGVDTQPSR